MTLILMIIMLYNRINLILNNNPVYSLFNLNIKVNISIIMKL